jgi:hypothetical protein
MNELERLRAEVEAALASGDERRIAELRTEITRRAAEHSRAAADPRRRGDRAHHARQRANPADL